MAGDNPQLTMTKLSATDDLSDFSCGSLEWEKDVSDFLKEDALSQQEMGLNVTWLCHSDARLVGFTSLVASNVQLKKEPAWKERFGLGQIGRTDVPCILVAQFGVDVGSQGQGIGKFMLSWVRGAAIVSSVGVKLLTLHVDNKNKPAREFWQFQGFVNFPPAGSDKQSFMVYDLYGKDEKEGS